MCTSHCPWKMICKINVKGKLKVSSSPCKASEGTLSLRPTLNQIEVFWKTQRVQIRAAISLPSPGVIALWHPAYCLLNFLLSAGPGFHCHHSLLHCNHHVAVKVKIQICWKWQMPSWQTQFSYLFISLGSHFPLIFCITVLSDH